MILNKSRDEPDQPSDSGFTTDEGPPQSWEEKSSGIAELLSRIDADDIDEIRQRYDL